jgi:hypothetical protein
MCDTLPLFLFFFRFFERADRRMHALFRRESPFSRSLVDRDRARHQPRGDHPIRAILPVHTRALLAHGLDVDGLALSSHRTTRGPFPR